MREASDWALTETSRQVQSAEGHLTMVDRLPKDGFTNMKGLEREYTSRHDDEDGAKLKDILIKDIQKLTPEERAIFRSTT
jgi:ribosomal protein L15